MLIKINFDPSPHTTHPHTTLGYAHRRAQTLTAGGALKNFPNILVLMNTGIIKYLIVNFIKYLFNSIGIQNVK